MNQAYCGGDLCLETVPANAIEQQAHTRTKITIHNIVPQFSSTEAMEKKKKEISQTLYRIFSKYNEDC